MSGSWLDGEDLTFGNATSERTAPMTDNETISKALGIEGRITGYSGTCTSSGVVESRVEREYPQYDADLNLIHSAEDALTEEEWERYLELLSGKVDPSKSYDYADLLSKSTRRIRHATAAQCAQALAKVLGGRGK